MDTEEIENRLHWVREVTMGEDGSQIRTRGSPHAVASLGNLAIGALRLFLTDEQAAPCAQFARPPTPAELDRCFFPGDADRERLDPRQEHLNRLGFAHQLGTVRFLGTSLSKPTPVPREVVPRSCNAPGRW